MLKASFRPPGTGTGLRERRGWKAVSWLLLGAVVLSVSPSYASGSGSRIEIKQEAFYDRNGVWNLTPTFALLLALSRKWSFGWEQEFDIVSGASRRIGSDKVGQFGDRELDAVSGASKIEIRHSANPSLTYAHQGFTATGAFYSSREDDYFSMAPSGSVSMDFFGRNTTLGASFAEFFDDFRPQGSFAKEGGEKRIRSLGLTVAQSLTPLTLVGLTGSSIKSWGYLGHPYNPPMDASGAFMIESVPGTKNAGALSAQIVQGYHLGGLMGSLNLDGRRYMDDWGLKSSTLDFKASQYISEGAYIRLRVRYYNQTGAVFAKPFYGGNEAYRTADIRFSPFTSWMVGAKLSSACPESWSEYALLPDKWDVKFDYMVRDTRGDVQNPAAGAPRSKLYQLYSPEEEYLQGVIMVGMTFNL